MINLLIEVICYLIISLIVAGFIFGIIFAILDAYFGSPNIIFSSSHLYRRFKKGVWYKVKRQEFIGAENKVYWTRVCPSPFDVPYEAVIDTENYFEKSRPKKKKLKSESVDFSKYQIGDWINTEDKGLSSEERNWILGNYSKDVAEKKLDPDSAIYGMPKDNYSNGIGYSGARKHLL